MAEFAEVAGLSPHTLSRWRHRLAQQEDPPRGDQRADFARTAVAVGGHRLVEVSVAEGRSSSSDQRFCQAFIIQLAEDRRIEVGTGFDAAELRRLVEVLETC